MPKKKGGRPSKFSKNIQRKIRKLALRGFTDDDIAEIIDVTKQTLNNWKKKYSEFFDSLKNWKLLADQKVERSLYERACGYSHPDTKAQFVMDDSGGRWEYADLIKHYPPDPTSMIFWLKNRQPSKWRDKQEIEESGEKIIRVVYEDPPECR